MSNKKQKEPSALERIRNLVSLDGSPLSQEIHDLLDTAKEELAALKDHADTYEEAVYEKEELEDTLNDLFSHNTAMPNFKTRSIIDDLKMEIVGRLFKNLTLEELQRLEARVEKYPTRIFKYSKDI